MADINASPFYTSVCRILIFPTCVWKKIRDDDPYVVFINYLPINGALSLRFFRSSEVQCFDEVYPESDPASGQIRMTGRFQSFAVFMRSQPIINRRQSPLNPSKYPDFQLSVPRRADLNASSKSITIRSISFTIDRYVISESTCAR